MRNYRDSTTPTRILIVDDHPAVREALSLRVGRHADLEVCGEAGGASEALELVAKTRPDVAVVDISLKSGNGLDLIRRIRTVDGNVRLLVWSMHSESLYAERALAAGALGYVNKDQVTERIIDAIRTVRTGRLYKSESISERLVQRAVGRRLGEAATTPLEALADRELEVFMLIGQGARTAEIADRLGLSVKTVETYRDRIRQKLNLADGTELAYYATRWVLENE